MNIHLLVGHTIPNAHLGFYNILLTFEQKLFDKHNEIELPISLT